MLGPTPARLLRQRREALGHRAVEKAPSLSPLSTTTPSHKEISTSSAPSAQKQVAAKLHKNEFSPCREDLEQVNTAVENIRMQQKDNDGSTQMQRLEIEDADNQQELGDQVRDVKESAKEIPDATDSDDEDNVCPRLPQCIGIELHTMTIVYQFLIFAYPLFSLKMTIRYLCVGYVCNSVCR